ncbi:MAG: ParA family protein [Thaumarchaeota archaeon]|nr:ParA family protein [Nitrososphaerota archaeon]MCL5317091.1 ParA family protein [Nitrososphaerota archaeon]
MTFVIACEYAAEHPDKNIVMLDLCPQANLSEIALGGNGEGSDRLESLIDSHKTIGGYFDERISSPQKVTGNETSFLVNDLKKYNPSLPSNVYLVAGDSSLEIQAQAISQISAQTLPLDSWSNVHKWLRDLISAIEGKLSNPVSFIDCNPSFASYTELAILASERLIIPCSADGSSARAIDNVGRLVYGTGNAAEYGDATFNKRALKNSFALPSIHTVILNRSTQYDKKASKSFNAMFNEIQTRVSRLKKTGQAQFSSNPTDGFFDMPDAHSVAVVCSHEGVPLSKLKTGPHTIHDTTVQVNPEPYARYNTALKTLVAKL